METELLKVILNCDTQQLNDVVKIIEKLRLKYDFDLKQDFGEIANKVLEDGIDDNKIGNVIFYLINIVFSKYYNLYGIHFDFDIICNIDFAEPNFRFDPQSFHKAFNALALPEEFRTELINELNWILER